MAGLLNNPYAQLDSQVRPSPLSRRVHAVAPRRVACPTLQRLTRTSSHPTWSQTPEPT